MDEFSDAGGDENQVINFVWPKIKVNWWTIFYVFCKMGGEYYYGHESNLLGENLICDTNKHCFIMYIIRYTQIR